jgi:ABC-type taurine transport system substrate-binding protein
MTDRLKTPTEKQKHMMHYTTEAGMKIRFDVRLFVCFIVLLAFLFAEAVAFSTSSDKSEDLSKHPVYSGYNFGKEDHVIDFATQPLASTMGVITELMRRDRILGAELKGQGIELRFHPFYKGVDINFFVRRGDIEIATLGDTPAITIASTYDAILAALTKQGYSSLIARKEMQITELKGRKIGYPAGSTAHFNLLIALYTAGMKESDVVHVAMEVNELPGAIEKGIIDAFSAWEPIPSAVLAKHREYAVVQKFLNSSYLAFTKSFVINHHGETALLMASYLRALRWMKKDEKNLFMAATWQQNALLKFQKKPSDSTVEQVSEILKREVLQIAEAPYIPLNDFDKNGNIFKAFEFLKSKGMIPQTVDWKKLKANLDRDIMAEVLSKPKKYKLDDFDYNTE